MINVAHLMGVVRSTLAKTFSVPLYGGGTLEALLVKTLQTCKMLALSKSRKFLAICALHLRETRQLALSLENLKYFSEFSCRIVHY